MLYAAKEFSNFINNSETDSDSENEDEIDEASEENNELTEYSLDIEIDKENILYKSFMNEVSNNNLDTNKKILVCCTGDYQSMALLTIAMNIFTRENINVLTINHDTSSNTMVEFIENICDNNNLTFHNIEIEDNTSRYEIIKDVCDKNNIDYVFEGHTLINYSNNILNNIFKNKKEEVYTTIRPFLFIDNITLLKFFSIYNIPIDEKLTHLNFSKDETKSLFDSMEEYMSIIYPNWRINIIKNYKTNNELINTTELENKCFQGKYGYLVKEDFNKISFTMFKQLVDNLSEKYGFEKVNVDDLDKYYMDDEDDIFFVSDAFLNKIDIFERYLQSNELQYIIEDLLDENLSENSFENLEIKNTINDKIDEDNEEDTEDIEEDIEEDTEEYNEYESAIYSDIMDNLDNSDVFKNNKEYILRVDLNNDAPDIKIVESLSENFRHEYLDGVIYINIANNDFYVYDVNFNK